MPGATDRWTAERVRALPDDGNRYELIGGELVVTPAPGPAHQVACAELYARLRSWLGSTGLGTALLLAVEVLSPSTARYDRGLKRRRYQRAGVPEYWIVDLDARLVERWRPDDTRPEIAGERLVWEPASGVPPFTLELSELFSAVLGEG